MTRQTFHFQQFDTGMLSTGIEKRYSDIHGKLDAGWPLLRRASVFFHKAGRLVLIRISVATYAKTDASNRFEASTMLP